MTQILILTPMKNAERHLQRYFEALSKLSFPTDQIALGFLEGDSADATAQAVERRLPELRTRYGRAEFWKRDFGAGASASLPRWTPALQLPRRRTLARARNHLLFRALRNEDWVLWLDVDVIAYPPDLIQRFLATGRDLVHPHVVKTPGGSTFDRNAWRDGHTLDTMRGGEDLVRLDAVGGAVLWVKADLHRDGLIFPPFLYGQKHRAVRSPHPLGWAGEIETEGLGLMAQDMGRQAWGMPHLEAIHADE